MHIGFITSHFPFPDAKSVGGIGTSIKNLGAELVALDHKVTVFVYGQQQDEKFIEEGIAIFKIKNVKFKGFSGYLTRKKIQRIIKDENKINKIDVVEVPDWEGISSFIDLHCPIVIRLHGSDTYFCHLDQRPVKWINKFHEQRAFKNADAHLSVSQYTADVTNRLFKIKKNISIIHNGVNTAKFKEINECEASFGISSTINESQKQSFLKPKIILYFGGIIRKKGVLEIPHYFNKVIQKIPDVQLILIGQDMSDQLTGNDSTFQIMEKMFSNAALYNVKFIGSVPHQEIKKYIAQASVCIFPSYAEALPVSWIEAMAMQKAIVASNIGWASEIIDDGVEGFLIAPSQYSEYANKIIELIENNTLQRQFGIAARKKVEHKFSMSEIAQQSVMFYKSLIN